MERFIRFGSVIVGWDEKELASTLNRVDELSGEKEIGSYASAEMIQEVRRFVEGADASSSRRGY